jgi:DNA-binding transcriptional LysR family regulator
MLDTWALRVLAEVGERGSFSAAAEALSMTQPAVSRQVASLERKLGVSLFRRVPRGIRATSAGEVAIERARDILARLDALQARMGAFAGLQTGHVRISAFPSANTAFVPAAIHRFASAYPTIEVSLVQADPSAIRDGRLDIALVTDWDNVEADLELVPLLDEELKVALPARHPLARRTRVPLDELRDEVWIEGAHPDCLGPIPRLTEALGAPPRVGFTCDDWTGKLALVAGQLGITLIPTLAASVVRPDVIVRATTPALPKRRVFAAVAPAPLRTAAANAMLTQLRNTAATRK